MRMMAILAGCAMLSLAPATQVEPGRVEIQSMQAKSLEEDIGTSTASVMVAELTSLPRPVQEQVTDALAHASDQQLQALRRSIDAIPQACAALRDKGKNARDVIAAAFDEDGSLLLITLTSI